MGDNKSYMTTLKRDGKIIYPQTLADAVYLKESGVYGVTVDGKFIEILDKINKLTKDIEQIIQDDHFRGAKNTKEEIYAISSPKAGDYAILRIPGEDDEFYIWDDTNNSWISKGNIVKSFVDSVNGMMGDVVLTAEHINTVDVWEPEEGKTEYTINEVLIKIMNAYATNERVDLIDSKLLNFKNDWVSGTPYNKNDLVNYGRNLYICIVNVPSGTTTNPSEDIAHWKVFVKGFDGEYSSLSGVPTKVSQFENDAGYVTAEESGKINSISLNGEQLTIDENKNVEISLPTFTILED